MSARTLPNETRPCPRCGCGIQYGGAQHCTPCTFLLAELGAKVLEIVREYERVTSAPHYRSSTEASSAGRFGLVIRAVRSLGLLDADDTRPG